MNAYSGPPSLADHRRRRIISQPTGANPGVAVGGGAGLEISDSAVLSVNGHGALFTAGTANKIVRSVIASGGQATAGVRATSNGSGDKSLLVESSILTGGGAGLSVETSGSSAGDVDVVLRHVTSAGANGLVLDASNAAVLLSGSVGNISADVTDSIVVNGTVSKESPDLLDGLLGLIPGNTVTSTYTRSLNGGFNADTVFVNPSTRNYRLKAGSPAIDAGGFTAGESTTDLDGEPRPGPVTDQGGDEFNPAPPAASAPTGTPVKGDGVAPAVVIKSPKHNERIKLTTTTKTTKKKLKNGKTKTTKKRTTKRTPISIEGSATDPAGIKGVIVTIQRTSAIKSKRSRPRRSRRHPRRPARRPRRSVTGWTTSGASSGAAATARF